MKIPPDCRWKPTGVTLGQGGQATICQVTDGQSEHRGLFALKSLSKGKPPKAYERFGREIATIHSLSHPGIIEVIDWSADEAAFPYYVMPYHDGALSLKRHIEGGTNPYFQDALLSLGFVQQLVEAIGAWSARGVVHRDLSPANVLILPDGTIRVIDFGLCQTSDAQTVTLVDEGVGTPNYMAPECEAGASGAAAIQADFYSAGKLLWSAVTNQFAFSREAPAFTSRTLSDLLPDSIQCWHLIHILSETIRHDPDQRWRTVEAALATIRHTRTLVETHRPPIETLRDTCPLCGVGKLTTFEHSHMVFGNPNPPGIGATQCSYCGICFARNFTKIRDVIENRRALR